MNNFTLDPMSDFVFGSVTMDYNLMNSNVVNNLVVDNSTDNDLMDITEVTHSLIIKDSGVDDLMAVDDLVVDDSMINSLTANGSIAYAHSTNTPVSMGDLVDTTMVDSLVSNGSTTDIFPASNPPAKDFMGSTANPPMTKSLIGKEAMVDSSVPTKRAASIFTPVLRESLRHQMLFVDGPRKTEGVWLCAKCIKHLNQDGNDDLRKWHTRYGIWPGLELHPEAKVKKLKCTHCKGRRRCNFVERSRSSPPPPPPP